MFSSDDIRARTVIDSAGLAIGEVEDILMDGTSWHVDALRVRLRREMTDQVGATRSFFRKASIDIPTSAIQSVGDAVLLLLKAEDLRPPSPPDAPAAEAPR